MTAADRAQSAHACLPDQHLGTAVATGGGDQVASGRKCAGRCRTGQSLEGPARGTRRHIPEFDRSVVTGGRDQVHGRGESAGRGDPGQGREQYAVGAGTHVPAPDRSVVARRHQRCAGQEDACAHRSGVTLQRAHQPRRWHLPDSHALIVAGRREPGSVWREPAAPNPAIVGELSDHASGLRLPDPCHTVISAGHQGRAVR